ncbi:MAG: hypothetical protein MZV64_44330 [Ignavibacteriales bacterium]|nr:hypothetical protein [Ignavibacteriales bacterium]
MARVCGRDRTRRGRQPCVTGTDGCVSSSTCRRWRAVGIFGRSRSWPPTSKTRGARLWRAAPPRRRPSRGRGRCWTTGPAPCATC